MIDIKPILRLPLRVRPIRIQRKLKKKQRIEKEFQKYLEEVQKHGN